MNGIWDYRVRLITVPKDANEAEMSERQLQAWGEEGWELVQIVGNIHYFKMKKG